MAEVVVESVSKLELLEANYENTKLLVNQETLKCQKWKQTIDLLLQEEKLHEKSLDVRRLRRTVEEKHHELEVTKERNEEDQKKLEDQLKTESEAKLAVQQEKHKQEKDVLEKEIKHLKDMKTKLEAEMKEMKERLISEANDKMKKNEEEYLKVKEQLSKETKMWKESHAKAEQEIEQLTQENTKNILAKENIQEEIKIIRRTLKTETDEKLIQQVEKSTKEKCQLDHEIKEWKEKHEKALQEIENFKMELSSKNVTTKVKSTQTQVTKTLNKAVGVNKKSCEQETQVDKELQQDLPKENYNPAKELQQDLSKENYNPSGKEARNDEINGDKKATECPTEKNNRPQKKQKKVQSKAANKGKQKGEKEKSSERQTENAATDNLITQSETKEFEKQNKKEKKRGKKKGKAERSRERIDEEIHVGNTEPTPAVEQEQAEKIDKTSNGKGKTKQPRGRKDEDGKMNEVHSEAQDQDDVVMEEQPFECDGTVAEKDESHHEEIRNEEGNAQSRGRKVDGKTHKETNNKQVVEDEVAMEEQPRNSAPLITSGQNQNEQSKRNTTKKVRKRKEPPLDHPSSDSLKAKKPRHSSSENSESSTQVDENPESNETDNVTNCTENLAKTTHSESGNGDDRERGLTNQVRKDVENQNTGALKEKNIPQHKSVPTKPPVYRPSTSSIRQSSTSDMSTILNGTKPPVYQPSMSIRQSSNSDMSSILNGTKPPVYRPSMSSIRQSSTSDMSTILNGTKPPVYRPSMSIRQSGASDMSSVLNGTKRRALYNSKANNSLMVSMLPLQDSFINSTLSREKNAKGKMPSALSSFLKSFTAPKLKKNTSA